jgi:RNA polymerase sigma-70 factor (ECF subfamily)
MIVRAAATTALVEAAPDAPISGSCVSSDLRFEFGDVYASNVGFVWRVLRGMGVSDALVEDAVQDAFVVVHRRLDEFDGRFSIKTWLFAIAYRIASDYRRKIKRAAHEPLNEALPDRAPTPAESAEQSEALHLFEELLDVLDENQRIVLILAEIEGMTAPEIAAITATPLNTVYSRLRRARAQLSEALAERKERLR